MPTTIYESTSFEGIGGAQGWAIRPETNIDSVDFLSPTLRQLVDTAECLYQRPDTFGFVDEISQRDFFGRQSFSISPGRRIVSFKVQVSSLNSDALSWSVNHEWTHWQISDWPPRLFVFGSGASGYWTVTDSPSTPGSLAGEGSLTSEDVPPSDDVPDFGAIGKKLHDWLGLTWEELAAITGVGRTTFFDWGRTARSPRSGTVQRLLRLYALARAVVGHLGATEAAAWFRAGQPSPLDLVHKRDLDGAEQAAAAILFRPPLERGVDYAAFAPETDFEVPSQEVPPLVRRSPLKARRVTLRAR